MAGRKMLVALALALLLVLVFASAAAAARLGEQRGFDRINGGEVGTSSTPIATATTATS